MPHSVEQSSQHRRNGGPNHQNADKKALPGRGHPAGRACAERFAQDNGQVERGDMSEIPFFDILATSKSHASQCTGFAGMRKCSLNQFAAFSL